ncbi:MAG TPA: PAC2 family protein, partial [Pseudolysinimonas sp.]|nr:PAC2 family protein [Pseudolysinimonas sp.]
MRDPGGLYDLSVEVSAVPRGLHLVAGLTGFSDAGNAVSQLSDYLLSTLDVREIVSFDTDALLDYRARRPIMTFEHDHLSEYKPSKLSLYLAKDELGQPFLLLTGFEPDFQWERFTAAVIQLIQQYQVADTTWVHAIPMPTPHTRPIGVTVSGNRTDLIDALSIWKPRTQLPA